MATILVTGAAGWVGGKLVQHLEARPDTEVHAVDELAPRLAFASSFRRLALDSLRLAELVLEIRPDTLLHLQTDDRSAQLGRTRAREGMSAEALFGAIARCPELRRVIVRSDAAVYGAGPRIPSVLGETTRLDELEPNGVDRYRRSLLELEGLIEEIAAELPAVTFTTLRFVGIFGAEVGEPLSRYLRLPVIPTLLGFDPRLQLIHEDDAVRAILHALDHPRAGVFNVAADGQQYLGRVVRLGRRLTQPLPGRQFRQALRVLRARGIVLPAHLVSLLRFGRVVDTSAMHRQLRFAPRLNLRRTVLAGYERAPEAIAALGRPSAEA